MGEVMASRVRIYGRKHGYGSHAQVTDGFLRAVLMSEGVTPPLVPLDEDRPFDDEAGPIPGFDAEHGVLTGSLFRCQELTLGTTHKRRWAMIAPNSSVVNPSLLQMLYESCTDWMVPSRWAATALLQACERVNAPARPILVVPHGVSIHAPAWDIPVYQSREEAYERGNLRFLHLTSSANERKGTEELLEAWAMADLPPGATLDVVAEHQVAPRLTAHPIVLRQAGRVRVHARMDLSPEHLWAAMRRSHVVVQPSRGEAFGLVPLEALCCGTPVMATLYSGHTEYLAGDTAGFVRVPMGLPEPLDDGPGAMAPSLLVDALAGALERAMRDWDGLRRAAEGAAPALRAKWSWHNALRPWLQEVGL